MFIELLIAVTCILISFILGAYIGYRIAEEAYDPRSQRDDKD